MHNRQELSALLKLKLLAMTIAMAGDLYNGQVHNRAGDPVVAGAGMAIRREAFIKKTAT